MSTIILPGGPQLSVQEAAPRYPAGDPFIFQHGTGGDTAARAKGSWRAVTR